EHELAQRRWPRQCPPGGPAQGGAEQRQRLHDRQQQGEDEGELAELGNHGLGSAGSSEPEAGAPPPSPPASASPSGISPLPGPAPAAGACARASCALRIASITSGGM